MCASSKPCLRLPSAAISGTARRAWAYGGCGAKIEISHTHMDATTFPVDANDSEGRFELLTRSRFQKYNQNNFWRNIKKVRPSTYWSKVYTYVFNTQSTLLSSKCLKNVYWEYGLSSVYVGITQEEWEWASGERIRQSLLHQHAHQSPSSLHQLRFSNFRRWKPQGVGELDITQIRKLLGFGLFIFAIIWGGPNRGAC